MSSGEDQEFANEQEVVQHFQKLQSEYNSIANTISELELEKRDHDTVLQALKDLDPERKSYRLVGQVLVERTVRETIPAVEENAKNLADTIQKFVDQLNEKGAELNTFKTRFKIRFRGESDTPTQAVKERASQGVLHSE
jgi:prefoldin subunit 2